MIVDLAGDEAHALGSVNVSALLFAGQNRFTALRRFAIQTCTAVRPDPLLGVERLRHRVHEPGRRVPVGPAPAARTGPEHPVVRRFSGSATHMRFVVLTNQCTGGPDFQGDQDDDPINITDCSAGSVQDLTVRAAEVQVFGE